MRALIVCLLMGTAIMAQAPNPESVRLVGDRFKPLTYDTMTPEQKKMVADILAGDRKNLGGPFNVLLRSPEMGDLAAQFGGSMRFHSSVPTKLNEMAIIITSRYWTAQFEWSAHKRAALQAGLSPAIVDAIANGQHPASLAPDEKAVYDFCTELLKTKQVSDATFAAAKNAVGEKGVVDLMGVMGWYQMVSMLLNVDRYPLGDGVQPDLKPLANPLP
jgi:4-carboxymuconolactone decarboxylase